MWAAALSWGQTPPHQTPAVLLSSNCTSSVFVDWLSDMIGVPVPYWLGCVTAHTGIHCYILVTVAIISDVTWYHYYWCWYLFASAIWAPSLHANKAHSTDLNWERILTVWTQTNWSWTRYRQTWPPREDCMCGGRSRHFLLHWEKFSSWRSSWQFSWSAAPLSATTSRSHDHYRSLQETFLPQVTVVNCM